ncbi:TPA: S8 family serine peptidase, partial [Burkholderia cenocepacia]|nr:S8 family serine peptidase [Burkholderia cenocepacia]
VLDDGLDIRHPDLKDRIDSSMLYNFDSNANSGDPTPSNNDSHGTAVGGIIAATGIATALDSQGRAGCYRPRRAVRPTCGSTQSAVLGPLSRTRTTWMTTGGMLSRSRPCPSRRRRCAPRAAWLAPVPVRPRTAAVRSIPRCFGSPTRMRGLRRFDESHVSRGCDGLPVNVNG